MRKDDRKTPPGMASRLLQRFLRDDLVEEVSGDLEEKFYETIKDKSLVRARINYWYQVINYIRPFALRKTKTVHYNNYGMFKNYFKIGYRNLWRNKGYSLINIGGLAVGIAVAMMIGLWVQAELSYDTFNKNYDRVAQVFQAQTINERIFTGPAIPVPLEAELQKSWGNDFKYIAMSSWNNDHILSYGLEKFSKEGNYMGVDAPKLMDLKILKGTIDGLKEPGSIMLSESVARALFGDKEPINELMKIDNKLDVKVTAVYEDIPQNSQFNNVTFIAPWTLYVSSESWIKRAYDNQQWGNNSFQMFVQIADNADMNAVSAKIVDAKLKNVKEEDKKYKQQIFLHPMKNWHLQSRWDNGVQKGGLLQYVWLFSIVGVFVLLLACINFMNLSTARSEQRAKEVGIRKSIGSMRGQLVSQFLSESFLVVLLSFVLANLLVFLLLPSFNLLADKTIQFPLTNVYFWIASIGFVMLTGFLAGSYPALYLSSFQPVKVLKGTFRGGRYASLPRKILVVTQFTISVSMVIGTIIVYNQVQFTKNRAIGYDNGGVVMIQMKSPDFQGKLDMLRNELKANGSIEEISESSSPMTAVWSNNGGFSWEGKDPGVDGEFGTVWVTEDFGKTVGWKINEGRDYSHEFVGDSASVIMNQTAVKFTGLDDPLGKTIDWGNNGKYTVVGVVEDMLMESPFRAVKPTLFFHGKERDANWLMLKLNAKNSLSESLAGVEGVFKKYLPMVPFDYKFLDEQHGRKFASEERVGKLSGVFAVLAIFISCLGLFGLASFVAEQRTKEIGIRKVMGASVSNLWRMLSKDFVLLIIISSAIAIPISYYMLANWLKGYEYHTQITWWTFVIASAGSVVVTLLTVSYQAIRAAVMNPVRSLRSE